MHIDDFNMFCDMLKKESGLVLSADKSYLLETRLMPVARKLHLQTIEELALKVRNRDRSAIDHVVDAMTTNESSFFRDMRPFEQFRKLLLENYLPARADKKRLRIWSAACSSGQEVYSLIMLMDELKAKLAGWQIEVLATDLSKEMIQKAKEGVYSQFEVQRGLPITSLIKYFDQHGDKWQFKSEFRNKVQFKEFNLLNDFSSLGKFDIVFCRNVLIYFDPETKGKVLSKIHQLMPDDGTLYLGGAETVLGICDKLKPLDGFRGIYVKSDVTQNLQLATLKAAVG